MAKNTTDATFTVAQLKALGFSQKGNVMMIAPDLLRIIPDYNVREDFNPTLDVEDEQLYNSIVANGWQEDKPGVCAIGKDGKIYVIQGHRRLAATNLAMANGATIKFVPFILEPKGADEISRTFDLVLSNSGKNLSQLSQGISYQRLVNWQWTPQEIATRVGYSLKHVNECLKFCKDADKDKRIARLVKRGATSASLAMKLDKVHGPVATAEIITKAEAADKAAGGTGRVTGKNVGEAELAVTGKQVVSNDGEKARKAEVADIKARERIKAEKVERLAAIKDSLPAVRGPFRIGRAKDGEDLDNVFNGDNLSLIVAHSDAQAREIVMLLNLGWARHQGAKPDATVAPATAKVAPATAMNGEMVKH